MLWTPQDAAGAARFFGIMLLVFACMGAGELVRRWRERYADRRQGRVPSRFR